MSEQRDLVIVGAGIVGLSLADVALRAGVGVTVLDRGVAGKEASWAGAGMLTCRPRIAAHDGPADYYDLALWSVRLHAEWAARLKSETGIETGYRVCGALELSRVKPAPAAMAPDLAEEETSGGGDKETISKNQTAEWIRICESRGVPARWVDEHEARKLEPALGEGILGAIDFPNEAQVRNPWMVQALKKSVELRGGKILENAQATELVVEGERVTGVKLVDGSVISAGNVAVCTGAWTGVWESVTKWAPELKKIQPVRGEIVCYEGVAELATRLICERNHYFVPRGDGVLLVGATHERAGFEKRVTEGGTAELESFAHGVLPALKAKTPAYRWAGLRPGMKGRHPLIGAIPAVRNLFVSAGHYRNGVTLAPASAEMLFSIIAEGKTEIDPSAWAPK